MAMTARIPQTTTPTTTQTQVLTLPAMRCPCPPPPIPPGTLPDSSRFVHADRIVALPAHGDGLRGLPQRPGPIALLQREAGHLEVRPALHPAGGARRLRRAKVRQRLVPAPEHHARRAALVVPEGVLA